MSTFQRKPTQFELFPKDKDAPVHAEHRTFFVGKLSLSIESITILMMAVVVIMVMSFSLGMEKGKRISKSSILRMLYPQRPTLEALSPSSPVPEEAKANIDNKIDGDSPAPAPLARVDEGAPVPRASDSPKGEEEKVVDKFYTIQVASFKKRAMAQKEAMQLQDKGYDIMVVPKGQYSIVCVGKFPVEEEAKVVSQELKKKYKDCLIRRL